jgi:hypothetical protein
MHFRGFAALNWFYGTSWLLPSFAVGIGVLLHLASFGSNDDPSLKSKSQLIALFALAATFLTQQLTTHWIGVLQLVVTATAFTVLSLWIRGMRKAPRVAALPVLVLSLCLFFGTFNNDFYVAATKPQVQVELDSRKLAVAFQDAISHRLDSTKSVGFWYDTGKWELDAIQSTFLWGYTLVSFKSPPQPDKDMLANQATKTYLVVMSNEDRDIQFMYQQLCAAGVFRSIVDTIQLGFGDLQVFGAVLGPPVETRCGENLDRISF